MLSEDEYNLLSKTQHDNPDLYALFEKIIGSYSGSLNHLTHEFRNIITLINSNCQLMQFKNPDFNSDTVWTMLNEDVVCMTTMISEISNLCENSKLEIETFEGYSYFNNLCVDFRDTFNSKNFSFTYSITKHIPSCSFDTIKIWQALYYVLNFIFSCNSDDICVNLRISFSKDIIKIVIKDNNKHYKQNKNDNIFTAFYRSPAFEGTRTSLCFAKKIFLLHNGSITHRNLKDSGNEFVITLPCVYKENVRSQTSDLTFLMF